NLAQEIAHELDSLNRDRRQIEQSMQDAAAQQLAKIDLATQSAIASPAKPVAGASDEHGPNDRSMPTGLCLYDENWHQGVVGILASRIKEQYHRPVVCFAPANDTVDCAMLKGSARSIPGFHIRDALDAIAASNPGLIEKFGGHAMAAGLSLSREVFANFAAEFDRIAAEQLSEQDLQAIVLSDGPLNNDEISLPNAKLLKSALPWGQKLPEPLFDGEFLIVSQRLVGQRHLKLVLAPHTNKQAQAGAGANVNFDAIAFNIDPECWPDESARHVKIGYLLDVNAYRGRETVQFIVRHLEKIKRPESSVQVVEEEEGCK
ncbi:MAG: hypothetical protein HKO71_07560, partial [Pseudomonadales bacterium]|nr:hypothetical protein [Pseudomonadales bacterium]